MSKKIHDELETYYKWKYEADKDLVKRTAFRWTILRPGYYTESPGQGVASVGRTHLSPAIPVSCIVGCYTEDFTDSDAMLTTEGRCRADPALSCR